MEAVADSKLAKYEQLLTSSGGEIVGALEWAIKDYLRHDCRQRLSNDEYESLRHPVFNVLIELLRKHSVPKLDDSTLTAFEEYRREIRNPGEHNASVPSAQLVIEALHVVRKFIVEYLGVEQQMLDDFSISDEEPRLAELKREYFSSLVERFEFLDLGGISPRVGNKTIRIRMEDIFVPLQAIESISLLESFNEDFGHHEIDRPVNLSTSSVSMWEEDGFLPTLPKEPMQPRITSRSVNLRSMLEEPRLVILGDPGSGKTTVVRHISYSIASSKRDDVASFPNNVVPIIVRASEFGTHLEKEPSVGMFDYVISRASSKFSPLFERAIRTGNALIIIDGLDEIASAQSRVLSSRRIEEFVAEFASNRFVVTSRLVGYRQNQLAGNFKEVQLGSFDSDQVLSFLTKWHQAIEQESAHVSDSESATQRAKELWTSIRVSPGTRRLATNPLLLTIIALISWRGSRLPNRRVELYQIATETLLENWPLRQRGQELRKDEILPILEPVAFEILKSGNANAISEFDLKPLVEGKVCEVQGVSQSEAQSVSREILDRVAEHTGFFIERGIDQRGRRIYGFLHLTFAEYLAGRFLAERWSNSEDVLRSHAHDFRWREVMLLMAGHVATWNVVLTSNLVTDMVQLGSAYEEYIHRDLLMAASMLADSARVNRQLQDSIVHCLIDIVLNGNCDELISYARHLLELIAQTSSLGGPASRLDPDLRDDVQLEVRKAAICKSIGRNIETSTKILADRLVDKATSSMLRIEISEALLRGDGEDGYRTDAVIGVYAGGLKFARSASSEAVERLKSSTQVITGLKEIVSGIEYGIASLRRDELRQLDAEQVVDVVLSAKPQDLSLLEFALSLGMRRETIHELLDRGVGDLLDPAERAKALSAAVVFLHDGPVDEELDGEFSQSLKTLALSNVASVVRAGAAQAYVLISGDVQECLKFAIQMLRDFGDKQKLLNIIRNQLLDVERWSSEEEREAGLVRLGVRGALLQLLAEDAVTRRAAAYTLVEARLFSDADIAVVLEALNSGIPSDSELIDILGTFWTLMGLSEFGVVVQQVLPALCDFSIRWQPSEVEEGFDDFAESLDYLAYARRLPFPEATSEAVNLAVERLLESDKPAVRHRGALLWRYFGNPGPSTLSSLLKISGDTEAEAVVWSGIPAKMLGDPDLLALAIRSLSSESAALSDAVVTCLSRIQDESLRSRVFAEVAALLEKNPKNAAATTVLWRHLGPSRRRIAGHLE